MSVDIEDPPTMSDSLRDAAKFLRDCRGTEPFEYFCQHARNCEDAAAALDTAIERAERIMKAARQMAIDADAIVCVENDTRHDRARTQATKEPDTKGAGSNK